MSKRERGFCYEAGGLLNYKQTYQYGHLYYYYLIDYECDTSGSVDRVLDIKCISFDRWTHLLTNYIILAIMSGLVFKIRKIGHT